jgi:hypothetical protein
VSKSNSLNRRKDNRTVEKFLSDIKQNTLREKMLMDLWVKEMTHRGHVVTYIDNGVDNSGEFLEFTDNRPDFKVTIDGVEELYEVKANPWSHKQTFKVFDLQSYVKFEAKILLFYGIGHDKTKVDYDSTRWGVIDTKGIEIMLAGNDFRTGDAKWGGKPVVVIYPRDYPGYFKEETLTHE